MTFSFGFVIVIASVTISYCYHVPIVNCRYNELLHKVCASNGKTYDNVCDFKQDKLLNDPLITVIHKGSCRHTIIVEPEEVTLPDFNDKDEEYLDSKKKNWREKIRGMVQTLLSYLNIREKKKQTPKSDSSKNKYKCNPVLPGYREENRPKPKEEIYRLN